MKKLLKKIEQIPKETRIFQFGSSLNNSFPNDIDLLIEYDEKTHHPKEIHKTYKNTIICLQAQLVIPLDVTFLTKVEFKAWTQTKSIELICVYP